MGWLVVLFRGPVSKGISTESRRKRAEKAARKAMAEAVDEEAYHFKWASGADRIPRLLRHCKICGVEPSLGDGKTREWATALHPDFNSPPAWVPEPIRQWALTVSPRPPASPPEPLTPFIIPREAARAWLPILGDEGELKALVSRDLVSLGLRPHEIDEWERSVTQSTIWPLPRSRPGETSIDPDQPWGNAAAWGSFLTALRKEGQRAVKLGYDLRVRRYAELKIEAFDYQALLSLASVGDEAVVRRTLEERMARRFLEYFEWMLKEQGGGRLSAKFHTMPEGDWMAVHHEQTFIVDYLRGVCKGLVNARSPEGALGFEAQGPSLLELKRHLDEIVTGGGVEALALKIAPVLNIDVGVARKLLEALEVETEDRERLTDFQAFVGRAVEENARLEFEADLDN